MTMRRAPVHAGLASLIMLGCLGCSGAGDPPASNTTVAAAAAPAPAEAPSAPPAETQAKGAVADMAPTQGSAVKGRVTFTPGEGGVRVVADFTGLTPGEHGFHIHEKGDCSAPDAASAGAHFNPGGQQHGAPGSAGHHAGDLGNIVADKDGAAHLEASFPHLALSGPESILGLGLIVHAAPDDMKTQPTGNAGGRLACGVIKAE